MDHAKAQYALFVGAQASELSAVRADLKHAIFHGARLNAADFGGCDLLQAQFADAQCQGARFGGCNLTYADFSRADLTGADLSQTTTLRTKLHASKTEHADWTGTDRLTTLGDDPDLKEAETFHYRITS